MKSLIDKQIKLFTDISGDDKAYFHKDVKEHIKKYTDWLEYNYEPEKALKKFKQIFGEFEKND